MARNHERQFCYQDVLSILASSSLKEKVIYSVELLRKAERLATAYDAENGYFLAFSGGKDSQCLYHIAKIAGVKFKAHMNLTSVDPPEVIRFVRDEYPDVELIKPIDSIYSIARQKGSLPTRLYRWCCQAYKEGAGAGKVTLIGIRNSESRRRATRNEVEITNRKFSGTFEELAGYRVRRNRRKSKLAREINISNVQDERVLGCIHGRESLLISPIIHWTEDDVWEFLNALKLKHCELYDQGWKRIGCIGCPEHPLNVTLKENERWPHVMRNWIRVIEDIQKKGRYNKEDFSLEELLLSEEERRYIKAKNVYDWWISKISYEQWLKKKKANG